VRYDNLEEEAKRRSQILEQAQSDLTSARASHAAAQTASLISRIGRPETGLRPLGPGTILIAVGGSLCGLALGLGLVFLTAPLGQSFGRRITDRLRGRRTTDIAAEASGRQTDHPARRAADSIRTPNADQPGRFADEKQTPSPANGRTSSVGQPVTQVGD
jgi:hypothetical protein